MSEQTKKLFNGLLDELQPKRVRAAMKSALLKEGRKIANEVKRDIKSTSIGKPPHPLHNAAKVAQAVRVSVARDVSSMAVKATSKPGKRKGMHVNRRGQVKPVAMFIGSSKQTNRLTKNKKSRGFIQKQDWFSRADRLAQNELPKTLQSAIEVALQKQMDKYGNS
jgi:hypothetical protein